MRGMFNISRHFQGPRVPHSQAQPKRVFLGCHYCGYAPPKGVIPKDRRCPKCNGHSWERWALALSLVPEYMRSL